MARDLTAAMQAEVVKTALTPILFYEGEFSGGTVRFWTGFGTIVWNGQSWLGAGQLGKISAIQEAKEVSATGITVSLSGIPSSLIATALSQARQGKPGKIWFGCLNSSGAVIADPFQIFEGRLDVPEIRDGPDSAEIIISYESELVDLERPNETRYTSEDQKIIHPTDKGFDFVPAVQEWDGKWGVG